MHHLSNRNIHIMDLYESDAYKLGLVPTINQMITEINNSMNDEESSDSLARKTARIRELLKLQNRIRGIAEQTKKHTQVVKPVKYFTQYARDVALYISKIQQIFDTLCRKSR